MLTGGLFPHVKLRQPLQQSLLSGQQDCPSPQQPNIVAELPRLKIVKINNNFFIIITPLSKTTEFYLEPFEIYLLILVVILA